MALSLLQKDALTTSPDFLGRIRQAVREIARYHRDNPGSPQDRRNWATAVIDNGRAAQIAVDLAGELVTDGAILNSQEPGDAGDVPDLDFKGAVEIICFKYGI